MKSPTLQPRRFGCLFFYCLSLVVIASGCSQQPARPDYENLGLAEVSGTVLLDKKPLPNAHVIFESPDQTYSSGKTNSSGTYTLMFNSEQSGVLPGQKIVRIQLGKISEQVDDEDVGNDETDDENPLLEAESDSFELPATYHSNSQLTATVAAGKQVINFELESDGSTILANQ